ncbi:MAG: ABC transporter permease [Thermoproteus sp.]
MFEEFQLAWRALWERKGRTIGTIVGVMIAFVALSLAVSVGNAFKASTQSFFTSSFGTNNIYIVGQQFTDADVSVIASYISPYATAVVPVASAPATAQVPGGNSIAVTLYGVPAQNISALLPNTALYDGTNAVAGSIALMGYYVAFDETTGTQRLYVGTPIVLSYRGKTYTLVTGGIIAAGTPNPALNTMTAVVVDINEFRAITGITTYRTIVVTLKNQNYVTQVQNVLKAIFPNAEVFSPQSIAQTITAFFTGLELFLGLVSGVSTVITALWLYDTMTISVIQRTREFGILRAIGFKKRQITAMMLYEALIIAAIGIAAGAAIMAPLSLVKINFFSLAGQNTAATAITAAPRGPRGGPFGGASQLGTVSLSPDPRIAAIAALIVLAVNLVGALVPAVRAGRLNLVDALRYE